MTRARPEPPAQAASLPPIDAGKLAELEQAHQAELAQTRQAALEEGMKRAREAAAGEIKTASDRLAATLRDLAALKRRIRSEAEADVVKLSIAVARRILKRELTADPASLEGVVHAALQKLQNREIHRVRVAPAVLDVVRASLERVGLASTVTVVAEPKMQAGDLIFETALGELDASVETQLIEIERGFTDRLGL